MVKRACGVFALLVFLFCIIGIRTADIAINSEQAAVASSSMSIDLETLRGTVYDCNMQLLTNCENSLYVAAKPTNRAIAALKKVLLPEIFDSVIERMSKGKPVAVKAEYSPEKNEDIAEINVAKRYSSDSLACHIIGYLDNTGRGVSGIEKSFNEILSKGTSTVNVKFSSNARGRVMLGEEIAVEGNNVPKNGVVLTIDKDIQEITENALDSSEAECAAAVVIEIESGAIRASVSRPLFNPEIISESLGDENSPFINRAFLPFSVGSVFKPVVAAAALESGISGEFEYNCTGCVTHNGVTFNCHEENGHGVLNMEQAVAKSCNTYFIALALETGAENVIDTAEKFGFGKPAELAEGINSSSGVLPDAQSFDSKAAVANISFGQGELTATPLQICSMMAAIARGGVYVSPCLIEGEVDENGKITEKRPYSEKKQIISERTAALLRRFLEKVVSDGSGRRAGSDFVACAGKTATAQTGRSENGEEIYNAWFAGYFPADNPKYAVAILRENGGEGAISCAPVFRKIAEMVTATE